MNRPTVIGRIIFNMKVAADRIFDSRKKRYGISYPAFHILKLMEQELINKRDFKDSMFVDGLCSLSKDCCNRVFKSWPTRISVREEVLKYLTINAPFCRADFRSRDGYWWKRGETEQRLKLMDFVIKKYS